MRYPIAIEHGDDNTAFGVIVPDLPGCFSAGDTFDEAFDNAHDAIALHLEGLAEDGEVIPLPLSIGEHQSNSDYDGMTWALAEVDVSRYMGKTEKINVTLPSRLVHLIDEKVSTNRERYKSRSSYLAMLAEKALSKTGSDRVM